MTKEGNMNETDTYDFFDYSINEDGSFSVTKNGGFFLLCTGRESDVREIVETLRKDAIKHEND